MVVFPVAAALISLACTLVIARDALARPRPDKIAWTAAFAIFAIAASAEVLGSMTEWSATLARVYYLAGAVLIVGYLALGELYLLAGRQISRFAPGVALLVTALAATIVFDAPVDESRLAADGWDAIERGAALKTLAISLNAGGTLVVVGGVLYSAWRFHRLGTHRHRMFGCLLIALGTLTVASGGTLTRLGQHEYLYIAMSIGVAIIFAGYLETRRPDPTRQLDAAPSSTSRPALVPLPSLRAPVRAANVPSAANAPNAVDPAIAFIEDHFLPLDDEAIADACRRWSVPPSLNEAFTRNEARRAWALRLRLSPSSQARFDAGSIPTKRQLSELYHEVLVDANNQSEAVRR